MTCVTFRWKLWESVPPHFLSAVETSNVPESACSIKSPRVKIAGGRSLSWPEIKTQGWDCMFWFFGGQGMWNLSSLARDGNCTPCSGRQSLIYWTSREVPQSAITTKQFTPKFGGLRQHWFIFSLMCLQVSEVGLKWAAVLQAVGPREPGSSWQVRLRSAHVLSFWDPAEGMVATQGKLSSWNAEMLRDEASLCKNIFVISVNITLAIASHVAEPTGKGSESAVPFQRGGMCKVPWEKDTGDSEEFRPISQYIIIPLILEWEEFRGAIY